MNFLPENIKNYMITVDADGYMEDLYKTILKHVQLDQPTIIITSKEYNIIKLVDEMKVTHSQLQKFVMMKYSTINEISKKLFQNCEWTVLLPTLVVVDISSLIEQEIKCSQSNLVQKIAVCIVSLQTYLMFINLQYELRGESSKRITSLFIVRSSKESQEFGSKHLVNLGNLYFYDTDIYNNIKNINLLNTV